MADSTKINSSLNKEKRNIISTEAGWLAVRQTRNNIIIIMIDVECCVRPAGGPCRRTIAVTCSCSGFPVGRFAVYISLNDGTVICDKIKDDKVKIFVILSINDRINK